MVIRLTPNGLAVSALVAAISLSSNSTGIAPQALVRRLQAHAGLSFSIDPLPTRTPA